MCNPAAIPYVIAAVTTVAAGVQAQEEGNYQKKISRYNARNLENQATKTRNKGVKEENKQRRLTAQFISKQRAQLAAGNLNLATGTPLQLQENTATLGEVDALTIRENFIDQAEATEERARLTLNEGNRAATRGRNAFQSSVLIGGLNAVAGGAVGGGFTSAPAAGPSAANTSVNSKWYSDVPQTA